VNGKQKTLEELYAEGLELEAKRVSVVKKHDIAQTALFHASEETWGAYEGIVKINWPRLSSDRFSHIPRLIRSIPQIIKALADYIESVNAMFALCDELVAHQQRVNGAQSAFLLNSSDDVRH
jgi:hypothetical protein